MSTYATVTVSCMFCGSMQTPGRPTDRDSQTLIALARKRAAYLCGCQTPENIRAISLYHPMRELTPYGRLIENGITLDEFTATELAKWLTRLANL